MQHKTHSAVSMSASDAYDADMLWGAAGGLCDRAWKPFED